MHHRGKHSTHLHTWVVLVIGASFDSHSRECSTRRIRTKETHKLRQIQLARKLSQVTCNAELVLPLSSWLIVNRVIQQA